jgi:hypothetical protein
VDRATGPESLALSRVLQVPVGPGASTMPAPKSVVFILKTDSAGSLAALQVWRAACFTTFGSATALTMAFSALLQDAMNLVSKALATKCGKSVQVRYDVNRSYGRHAFVLTSQRC